MISIFKEKPVINSSIDALKAIKTIASDKSERVLLKDHVEWLEAKLNEIKKIAALGLKAGIEIQHRGK